jgi:hypothetical protein
MLGKSTTAIRSTTSDYLHIPIHFLYPKNARKIRQIGFFTASFQVSEYATYRAQTHLWQDILSIVGLA